jgi:hypothetical protein
MPDGVHPIVLEQLGIAPLLQSGSSAAVTLKFYDWHARTDKKESCPKKPGTYGYV